MIKLFSTFNLVIPITLAMIITKVEPKIKKLLLFATDAKNDVIIDFSVSLILSSFSEEKILNKEVDFSRKLLSSKKPIVIIGESALELKSGKYIFEEFKKFLKKNNFINKDWNAFNFLPQNA